MNRTFKHVIQSLSLALMLSGAVWGEPNGAALEQIDWDRLADSQKTVSKAVIEKYKPVLTGKQPFSWTFGSMVCPSLPIRYRYISRFQ